MRETISKHRLKLRIRKRKSILRPFHKKCMECGRRIVGHHFVCEHCHQKMELRRLQ